MCAMALDQGCLPDSSDGRESLVNLLVQAADEVAFIAFLANEEYGVRDGSYQTEEAGLSFATIG